MKTHYSVSISLDGFVAGPNQSPKHPLGVGGERLHAWMRELAAWRKLVGLKGGATNASTQVFLKGGGDPGAIIMGRNMFGGGPGPWKVPAWNGWWGQNPPFHLPVFVLTHYPREPLVCEGGTTFHFVTKSPGVALSHARKAAKGRDVVVSGGARTAQQFIESGAVDEILLHHVPVLLGSGVRLFDSPSMAKIRLQQRSVVEAPGVTHTTYRVVRKSSGRRVDR